MNPTLPPFLDVVVRAVGLLFVYAAVTRLRDPAALFEGLRDYRLLPGPLVRPTALLLVAAESVIAAAHLAGIWLTVVVPSTAMLLAVFLLVASIQLKRGMAQRCLCFGVNQADALDGRAIVRIGLLLGAELMLFWYVFSSELPWQAAATEPARVIESLLAAASVVAILSCCLAIPELRSWWRLRPGASPR